MSNAPKFAGTAQTPLASADPPEWIRKMSDHYVKTGTVRASDAERLKGSKPVDTQLTAPFLERRNDDGESESE